MEKLKKIVIGSRNSAKIVTYGAILCDIAEEVLRLGDFRVEDKPEEIGTTAEENAEIKAIFYSEKCGFPVFAEDEALYVDFLSENEQPGTHVRRINGKDEADDDALLAYWEKVILSVPVHQRMGRWHIAYCIAMPNGNHRTVSLDHEIVFFSPTSKVRLPGWPMSSLEGSVLIGKPHSEQTPEERKIIEDRTAEELRKCLFDLF
jgi:XTP/dITP diphosphohydrolase